MTTDLSDKAWLRPHWPQPQPDNDLLYDFIEGVGKRLDHVRKPSPAQLEESRQACFYDLTGIVV